MGKYSLSRVVYNLKLAGLTPEVDKLLHLKEPNLTKNVSRDLREEPNR